MAALRERSLLLEQQLRATEEDRKQLASELRELCERLAEMVGQLGETPRPADVGAESRAGR
jgi:hypothetical protein